MTSSSPRLRSDLTISRQQAAGGTTLVVKDPRSGRFFLFREAERFIAEQLDGETPLDVIRQRAEHRFGASLAADTLHAFVGTLHKSGLLHAAGDSRPRSGRSRRIRGTLLYLRVSLFDPDRLFTRLAQHLRFVFSRQFVALSAAIILLALVVTIANAEVYARDVVRLSLHPPIVLSVALLLLTVAVHESGHGVTCKHFGGEVRETGFLLIYFLPAFYCNVSDAWLFPERAKRLWVGFAGPYCELLLWALATLVWRVTETDTWINQASLIVMTISGLKILLNANPFLKLDGYYLLSDFLEMPNLRKRAFRHVGALMKRALGMESAVEETSPRERRVYRAYGLVATISSVLVLAYAAVTAGALVRSGQQVAVLLLAGVVTMSSRRRFGRLFGTSSDPSDATDEGDETEPATSHRTSSRRSSSRRSPSLGARWKKGGPVTRLILPTAFAGAVLALLFLGRLELRIAGPFAVLPQANADVRAQVAGLVVAVRVDEGDSVKVGDVVAQLSDQDLASERDRTAAEVREARANLRKLLAGSTAEEISVASASVARAEREVTYHRSRLARFKSMVEGRVISSQEFEDAQAQATSAQDNLAEASGRLNVLLRGTRREEIEASQAQIDRLETQRDHVEGRLGLLNVVSSVTGTVATPSRELRALTGRLVGQGALLARVYDASVVTAQLVIAEKEIADIRVGQRVALRSRAYPDITFEGTVTTIATSAEGTASGDAQASSVPSAASDGTGAGKSFIVTTQIDNRLRLLKPGMTGLAKVSCGERRIVDLIARRLARTLKVEFWSWW